ncbi:MAG: serine hydrolase [Planctomycetes bacterium]|nr:serine hydrolase [Planctomycetota bacterium]
MHFPTPSRLTTHLLRLGVAALALVAVAPTARAQTVYHDQTLGFQLGRYVALKSAGYRLVSLDVAGDLNDQHWSAVWEPANGLDWTGAFGMSASDFAGWRIARIFEGYRDEWITSSGAGSNVVYGGYMIRDGLQAFGAQDVDEATLIANIETYEQQNYLLESVSVHGTAASPRYALVLVENPGNVSWGYRNNDTVSSFQTTFDAFVQTSHARPSIITQSEGQRYLSVFRNDSIGSWVARHGMTKAGYESQVATLAQSGYSPYQIMVAGIGSAARYAALFRSGQPAPSVVTTTGVHVTAFDAIDQLMVGSGGTTGFMQQRNAQSAAVAITKNGRLVFARAYTFGPNGTQITQPTSGFRLASLSKPIAAIATYHLDQRDAGLTVNSRLVDLVSLGTPANPAVDAIRLRHLIDHTSGYNRGWSTTVTDKLATARSEIQSQMLASYPGVTEAYSNGGYQLLTVALEARSGRAYWDYVRDNLMTPLGIQRAHLITSQPLAGDMFCQEARWGVSRRLALEPNFMLSGSPLYNSAYAVSPVAMDGSGGVVMSAVDYVRLLSGVFDPTVDTSILDTATRTALEQRIQMAGRTGGFDYSASRFVDGRTIQAYVKGGLWRSAHTYGVYRTDGVAIAAFCTSPGAPDINAIQNIVDQVANANAWPTNDLFPSYGLPSYPRRFPGSTQSFGTGCGGLTHTTNGLPEIGMEQRFVLGNGTSGRSAFLFLGLSKSSFNGLPLPLELGFVGAPGCRLYTGPVDTLATTVGTFGTASLAIDYPNVPALIGAQLHTQYAMLAPRSNPLGLLLTNGITTVIGN